VWVAEQSEQPCLGRQLTPLFTDRRLRSVKSTPQVTSPPFQMFLRLTAGFLNVGISRGDLVQAEVDARLADIAEMAAAGVFTNGAMLFTNRREASVKMLSQAGLSFGRSIRTRNEKSRRYGHASHRRRQSRKRDKGT